jgi:hypothetical protein
MMTPSLLEHLKYLLGLFDRRYAVSKNFKDLCVVEVLKKLVRTGEIDETLVLELAHHPEHNTSDFEDAVKFLRNYLREVMPQVQDPKGLYQKLLCLDLNASEYLLLA